VSPSADRRALRRTRRRAGAADQPARDAGFTLLEIIVALGILTMVMVALLPQLIVGLRSTGTARLVTQAKGVAQGELERMRNLPFHIAPAAGDFVDVLDYYYPDVTTPTSTPTCMSGDQYLVPATTWSGYVDETSAARCDYEPSTGAFYRTVQVMPASAGIGSFTVVTATQFLSGSTPPAPVSPLSTYDTQSESKDDPASSQIGVTITVLYADRETLKPVSTYTQISQRLPSTTRVRLEADVRAVEVGSVTPDKVPLSLSAGLLSLNGSVSYASTVTANRAATSAGLATGQQEGGASHSLSAPPSATAAQVTTSAGAMPAGSCSATTSYACWGSTRLSEVTASAADGLPLVGSALLPAQAMLTSSSGGGLSFRNDLTNSYRTGLGLGTELFRLDNSESPHGSALNGCAVGTSGTGTSSYVTASGYLRTTATDDAAAPGEAEACAVARAESFEVLPTAGAADGIVRVELAKASARCLLQGSAHTAAATYDYAATVQYWNGSTYVTAATITPTTVVDPLDAIDLSTVSVGGGKVLGDYIASWSALTPDEVTTTAAAGLAEVTLPGVVTIATQPVRPDATDATLADESSVLSIAVGALDCSAEDQR
jgi:prepilin-type N-terminal cleavage/methylation domain-containing protein